ncbi:MAG: hypothetical protein PHT12_04405 [Patescibacteria group bacterium]|nr:hypothetical protein [Patescibacteria group bacterium]
MSTFTFPSLPSPEELLAIAMSRSRHASVEVELKRLRREQVLRNAAETLGLETQRVAGSSGLLPLNLVTLESGQYEECGFWQCRVTDPLVAAFVLEANAAINHLGVKVETAMTGSDGWDKKAVIRLASK